MDSAITFGQKPSQSSTQLTPPNLSPISLSSSRPSTSNVRPSTSTRGASSDSEAMECTLVGTTRNTSIAQQSPPRRASTIAYAQSLALPRTWNSAMDRLICQLDAQDAGLDVMFKELKRQFPTELGGLVLAKEAIATRLELLEWRTDWDGWKIGLRLGSVATEGDGVLEEVNGSANIVQETKTKDVTKENEKDRLADVVRKYEKPVGPEDDWVEVKKENDFPVLTKHPANGKAVDVEAKAKPDSDEDDPFTHTTLREEEGKLQGPQYFLRSRGIGGSCRVWGDAISSR